MFFYKNFEGFVLQDKYLFNQKIGGGNQGVIYLAAVLKDKPVIQGQEQTQVAIKAVNHESLKTKEKELLKNEIQALKEINSDYVVRCFECIEDQEYTYIVLEYCQYGSLEEFIKRNDHKKIAERFIKDYYRQILFGLQELHERRILHRDIKLSNILVKNKSEFKIGDLGFCKKLADNQNICQTVLGTKIYMAPELLRMENYGIEAELFSVGVLFYLLSQGNFPFEAKSPPQLLKAIENQQIKFSEISEDLQNLLKKMLKYNPKDRIKFKDIFEDPFFKEDDDIIFMNSSHVDHEEIQQKVKKYIQVYQKIENQIKPIPADDDESLVEDYIQVQKYPDLEQNKLTNQNDTNSLNGQRPDIQKLEFDLPPIINQPPVQINNFQNSLNQQPNNQFRNFSNQGNPHQNNQFIPRMNQNNNQVNNRNNQNQQQNQQNNFFMLNQQPNNFVPFQRMVNSQEQNNPPNQPNENALNNKFQQQQQFQNPNNSNNNNQNNNMLGLNQIPNLQGQNQFQNNNFMNVNQTANNNQMHQQNEILKKSSQYQFMQGSEINEQQQKNIKICDNLIKKAESIQESYLFLFLAMRNLAYLSGKCDEYKIPFQSYIGAVLFIFKQKCLTMNNNLQNQIQSQEYQPLREFNPQQYKKIVKNIENNKQEIDVFAFIAEEQYSQVKRCIYPIFQEFIQDYVKNISRTFDIAYNTNLRSVIIDMLLDVVSPAKVTSNHTKLTIDQKEEINKLIRNCCVYLMLSIYVDDNSKNIQELEQQLKEDNYNYKQKICDLLKELIQQVDQSLLIKDIESYEEVQQGKFEEYLKEQQKKYGDEFENYEEFIDYGDILYPLKTQFQRRLETARNLIAEQQRQF
ncbi:hypothetical protein ABPG72_010940 [Tetrahymena utriculariae]